VVQRLSDEMRRTAYDCQARVAPRSMLWSPPFRKRIGYRTAVPASGSSTGVPGSS